MPPDPALQVNGLTVSLGGRPVLSGVDLAAYRGRVTALLGPNGAGKTTIVRCCTGLLPAAPGQVSLLGRSPAQAVAQGRVGVMPQATAAWSGIRAVELLHYLASLHAHPLPVSGLVDRLGIGAYARTPYRRLSGGQQQAVNLAGALVGRPELVLLDEPTAGMDPHLRRTVWDLVAELRGAGVAVLLTTHAMDEAERLADRVALLDRGRIVLSGSVAQITAGGSSLEDVFLHHTSGAA